MQHRSDLVSWLDVNNPVVQHRVEGLQQSFIAKGQAPNIALQSAYKMLDFSVSKQAAVLSYMDVFLFTGILFLICIPFVLLVKNNKVEKKIDLSEALH